MPSSDFYALCGFVLAVIVQTAIIAVFIGRLSQKVEDLKVDFKEFKTEQMVVQNNNAKSIQEVRQTVIACGGYKKAAGHMVGDC